MLITRLTREIAVNGGQQQPRTPVVTALANQEWAVAWVADSPTQSPLTDVYARVIPEFGDSRTSLLLTVDNAAGSQRAPAITAAGDQNNSAFVVAYEDLVPFLNNASNTWIASYDIDGRSTGRLLGNAAGTSVASFGPDHEAPSVTSLKNGNLVVVWQGFTDPLTTTDRDIFLSVFSPSGERIITDQPVVTTADGLQRAPSVTALSNGNFVVVWQDESKFDQAEGRDVRGQIFSADGVPIGEEILINNQTTNNQDQPDVAALPGGGFVVTWLDRSGLIGDTSGDAIAARIFDQNGEASTPIDLLVNTITTGTQTNAKVASFAGGGFIVTWQDNSGLSPIGTEFGTDSSGFGIKAQVFTSAGLKVGQEFLVNDTNRSGNQLSPDVATQADGQFFITWQSATRAGEPGSSSWIQGNIWRVDLTQLSSAPIITSNGGGDLASAALPENTGTVTTVTAIDDPGVPLAFSIAGGADAAVFGIESDTGRLFFLTSPDFEAPSDANQDNVYEVTVAAGNGNESDTQTIAVRVTNVAEALVLTGTAGDDSLTGGSQGDVLDGLAGNDTLNGGDGDDTLLGGDGNDIISGVGGNDLLNGGAGFDQLFGDEGDDQLTVSGGADIVAGETLDGGAGFDFVSVETIDGDVDFGLLSVSNVEGLSSLGSPNRLLITSAQLAQFERVGVAARIIESGAVTLHNADFSGSFLFLGDAVTSFDASGIGAATDGLSIFGNGGANLITGSGISETLSGGDGGDSIFGGGGRDGLRGDGGDDRLEGGMGDDGLDGGAGIDLLYGQDGNDILTPGTVSAVAGEIYDGGSGFDLLSLNGVGSVAGGVDISAATIVGIEAIDGGEFSFSSLNTAQFMAASQLTGRLALTDGGSVSLTGKTTLSFAGDVYGGALQVTLSSFGNSIDLAGSTPAIGINVFGGIGNDVILGGSTGSQILAGGGNDRIVSRATNGLDNMLGGDGDDIIDARLGRGGLNGEAGNDVLMVAENGGGSAISGGTGSDRLIVEGNFFTGPVFDGIEAVQLTPGATLALTVDQFRNGLSSTATISGSGTIAIRPTSFAPQIVSAAALALASGTQLTIRITGESSGDQLTGHVSAINILDGGSGSDRLVGGNRNDVLIGGFGSDLLVGGGGADMMDGGEGNDRIVVDNLGDVATGGTGLDTLQIAIANVSYTVAADFEIVSNISGGALSITLNALANRYGGSGGIDVVLAGAGQDSVYGRAGNDQLSGEGGNDFLFGEVGSDTLDGGDGNDFLYGGTEADILLGGVGNDIIYGQDGSDLLTGGGGIDQLFGGAGSDRFIYTATDDTGPSLASAEVIGDFSQVQGDRIDLSAIDAVAGGGDNGFSFIGSAAFGSVAGQLRFEQIGGATFVQGDTDGDGIADLVIRIDGMHGLVAADFIL